MNSCWPTPSIQEKFDALQGTAYFTTMETSWGFYQLPIEPKSQNYTNPVHFWTPQMVTHANLIDGQFKCISDSSGTRARRTHVEHHCTLLRGWNDFFQTNRKNILKDCNNFFQNFQI